MDLPNISYRILRRLKLQPFLNWTGSRRIPGGTVQIPVLGNHLGSSLMLLGPYWKTEAFRQFARCFPVSMICDVGANEGSTIFDLRRAGLGALEVFAFEPNPTCAYYLQQLVNLNKWFNITVVPIALSDAQRCVPLELHSETDSGATLIRDLRPGASIARRQVVPCFTLDDLIQGNTVQVRPNFLLKIDVEGAELDVLVGSSRTLRESRPLVMCEVLWAHCEERIEFMRLRNAELTRVLRSHDYDVFQLVLSEDERSILGIKEIKEFASGVYSSTNGHQCDYAFVPHEHAARVREHFASDRRAL
jgi:FkbM family methyltransferase